MSIYIRPFTPTYLYIKQHTITGLLYFGQTSNTDPVKYKGSGKYWQRHLALHGSNHVDTLWFCLYFDIDTIREFALKFSETNDIVNSIAWANLKPETGADGGSNGPASSTTLSKRKATLASRTPEQKAATYQKWLASRAARTLEQKAATYQKWVNSHSNRTFEDVTITYEKWLLSHQCRTVESKKLSADRRSNSIANQSAEQKSNSIAKMAATVSLRTSEECDRIAAKQLATRAATRLAATLPISSNSNN